ncbi:hypothetical protein [Desnuesiella massiliensis]|uniref:hypothetical protein n=1 Tax=Desnuesiella massiliensis TaxID=1650662 RepID=UPI0006E149AE|nr:hypothetical protein [Desnuesiella massiliensis]
MKSTLIKAYRELRIHHLDFLAFLPLFPIIALTDKFNLVYIPFVALIIYKGYQVYKKQITLDRMLLNLSIYCVILPDNFIIIGFTGLFFLCFLIISYARRKKYDFYKTKSFKYSFTFWTIFLLLNIFLNRVPIQKILFFIIYYFVFIAMFIVYKYSNRNYSKEVDLSFNTIILLQIIYLVVFIPLRFSYILTQLIGDWSIGTLGVSQGPTLFNLFIFGFMKYFYDYRNRKQRKYIIFAVVCFLGAISTVSVSLTLIFIFSLFLYTLIYVKVPKLKVGLLALTLFLLGAFWITADPWVKSDLVKTVTNSAYRKVRIKKLQAYENTFLILPYQDLKFLAIGNGVGNYSSRAALTASGYYVSWYSYGKPYFKPLISEYTDKYIKPSIFAEYGISITEQPVSQYTSIMGEFGIIGFFAFMLFFIKLFIKGNDINKLTIIYFLGILLLDNWIEFPKISMIFLSTYFLAKNNFLREIFPS